MGNFFVVTLLLSLVGLIVGLIKPSLFVHIKLPNRKLVGLVFGGLLLISLIGVGITAEPVEQPTPTSSPTPSSTTTLTPEVGQENNQQKQTEGFLVTRVIDGDTIELEGGQRVRYIGIDTPETVDPRKPVQCFGVEASKHNKELVDGKRVRLEKDVSETDRYGRLVRYVYVNDIFINLVLVQDGFAYSYTYPPDVKYQSQFIEAQRVAREERRGLWGACPSPAPIIPTPAPSPESSSACTIKGNISSSGEKIYHITGCGSYNVTKIDEARGERWFCSEQESLAAGWRKALNCP